MSDDRMAGALRSAAVAGSVGLARWTGVQLLVVVIASIGILGCVRDDGSAGGSGAGPTGPVMSTEYHRSGDLAIGECADLIRDADDGEVLAVMRRPCGGPHDAEAIGVATHPTSPLAAYPSDAALLDWAEEACLAAFADYVGVSYSTTDLMAIYDIPTERSWAEGDRRSPCLVADLAGTKLVGSVRWAKPTDATVR